MTEILLLIETSHGLPMSFQNCHRHSLSWQRELQTRTHSNPPPQATPTDGLNTIGKQKILSNIIYWRRRVSFTMYLKFHTICFRCQKMINLQYRILYLELIINPISLSTIVKTAVHLFFCWVNPIDKNFKPQIECVHPMIPAYAFQWALVPKVSIGHYSDWP